MTPEDPLEFEFAGMKIIAYRKFDGKYDLYADGILMAMSVTENFLSKLRCKKK